MREKEPNNLEASSPRRFTLPKSTILRGKRNFQRLFNDSFLITSSSLKLRFAAYTNPNRQILVGFVAPKKTGNAVKRNRTRRLLREAYRLNQSLLDDIPERTGKELHLLFIARHTGLKFEQVQDEAVTLLKRMCSQLLSKNL